MSTGQFHKLLSPLSLGSGLTLKNRMIKAPQSSWFFEDDGSAGDRVIDFYEAIAAGGVGLVIVSAITWRSDHPAGAYGALHASWNAATRTAAPCSASSTTPGPRP